MILLSVVYAAVALGLVLVVISATSVHLERKRLLALADGAAAAAASALDEARYYGRAEAGGPLVVVSDGSVRAAAEAHLTAAPDASRFRDLQLADASTPDGRTAQVRLRARADLPVLTWATAAWSDGIELDVTARARAD